MYSDSTHSHPRILLKILSTSANSYTDATIFYCLAIFVICTFDFLIKVKFISFRFQKRYDSKTKMHANSGSSRQNDWDHGALHKISQLFFAHQNTFLKIQQKISNNLFCSSLIFLLIAANFSTCRTRLTQFDVIHCDWGILFSKLYTNIQIRKAGPLGYKVEIY